MKKEVGVAILAGFLLGGIAAITLTNLPNLLKNSPFPKETELSPTPIVTPQYQLETKIEINSPLDQSIIEEKATELNGKGKPEAVYLIESETEMKTIVSDKEGIFKEKVTLIEGTNNIYVTNLDENCNGETYHLILYHTGEKL